MVVLHRALHNAQLARCWRNSFNSCYLMASGLQVDGSKVTKAAIALFGVGGTPVRASEAEQALIAGGTSADLDAVGNLAAMNLVPSDDVHASGEYRKAVAATIVARAIAKALKEAQS